MKNSYRDDQLLIIYPKNLILMNSRIDVQAKIKFTKNTFTQFAKKYVTKRRDVIFSREPISMHPLIFKKWRDALRGTLQT